MGVHCLLSRLVLAFLLVEAITPFILALLRPAPLNISYNTFIKLLVFLFWAGETFIPHFGALLPIRWQVDVVGVVAPMFHSRPRAPRCRG